MCVCVCVCVLRGSKKEYVCVCVLDVDVVAVCSTALCGKLICAPGIYLSRVCVCVCVCVCLPHQLASSVDHSLLAILQVDLPHTEISDLDVLQHCRVLQVKLNS